MTPKQRRDLFEKAYLAALTGHLAHGTRINVEQEAWAVAIAAVAQWEEAYEGYEKQANL